MTGPDAYRDLLRTLDAWVAEARVRHPGVVPCHAGCTACCHGPFDVTIADAELIVAGLERLPWAGRAEVARRAAALLGRMHAVAPEWGPPYAVAALGEARFDRLCDALAAEPCPLLGDEGDCRIYEDRPMVCRLIGLPMLAPGGATIENACPIQDRYPAYAALAPQPFDLRAFEAAEETCLRAAARRQGDPDAWDFETTIAPIVAGVV